MSKEEGGPLGLPERTGTRIEHVARKVAGRLSEKAFTWMDEVAAWPLLHNLPRTFLSLVESA